MSKPKDTAIALNVRLKPVDHSNLPHSANYSNVGVAQGIVYVDFGFIEPALHPRGDGCGCAGSVASADPTSLVPYARCAIANAERLNPGFCLMPLERRIADRSVHILQFAALCPRIDEREWEKDRVERVGDGIPYANPAAPLQRGEI